MENDHNHNHTHGANKKTFISFFITSYMIVEGLGGFFTNSLALISDAGHMLSDSISLGIACIYFRSKQANTNKTFGYKRFEILAAVLNGITLMLIAIYIFMKLLRDLKPLR